MSEVKEPAALQRAVEMANHIHGEHAANAAVLLTVEEGFELMDYFLAQMGSDLMEQDALQARAAGDPWVVLQHFTLLGLAIERMDRIVH